MIDLSVFQLIEMGFSLDQAETLHSEIDYKVKGMGNVFVGTDHENPNVKRIYLMTKDFELIYYNQNFNYN